MPRQPFATLRQKFPVGQVQIGSSVAGTRPELEATICKCLMEWPNAEAEMGLLLGQILGIPNTAALAVFQSLRRSSAQRDAIISAAKTTLNDVDLELLNALLDFHEAIEKDRNALSHGHFGTYDKTPDVILWMATVDYIEFKARWHLAKVTITTNEKMSLFSRIYFYTTSDLSAIYKNITYVADMWVGAIRWLQATGLYALNYTESNATNLIFGKR